MQDIGFLNLRFLVLRTNISKKSKVINIAVSLLRYKTCNIHRRSSPAIVDLAYGEARKLTFFYGGPSRA